MEYGILKLTPSNSYATKENLLKAMARVFGPANEFLGGNNFNIIPMQTADGRWFAVACNAKDLQDAIKAAYAFPALIIVN